MDSLSRLCLATSILLVAAKLGGEIATRLKQPSVLGELVAGIVLGTLPFEPIAIIRTDPSVDLLAGLGVIVLLFEVGLESTVGDVLRVGLSSAAVAILGVVGALATGWAAAALLLPHAGGLLRAFLAASLTATSVSISARVLKDVGGARSLEAHTILGASILDDVLGLVVLGILSGSVAGGTTGHPITAAAVALLVAKTVLFLAVTLVVGRRFSSALLHASAALRTGGALVATGLMFCFLLAWIASAVGLAPIVGAFTAGLILEGSHSARFVARGEPSLAQRMEPIAAWLVPVFFVLMGARANLAALTHLNTLLLVVALTAAAMVGKLASGFGAPHGADRLAVGLGMLPRGEVSLAFASLGLSSGILDAELYSTLVATVVLTALVTPPLLRLRLRRLELLGAG
jgi:Kef-type K+ transport system membrane component KefB